MFLDVDECLDTSIVCDQVCINSVGTYHCTCEEGYRIGSDGKTCVCKSLWRISCVSSKLLPPSFSSSGTMETTYSSLNLSSPFLTDWDLFPLFSLLQCQLCDSCFSPSFSRDVLKGPQRVLPFSDPLPCLSSSNSLISLIHPCLVFPSFNQHVESSHFPVWS